MNSFIYLITFSFIISCSLCAQDIAWSRDPVTGEPLINEAAHDAIEELERNITLFHDKVIKQMPDSMRQEILSCETAEGLMKLPLASQTWLHDNAGQIRDGEVAKSVEKLGKVIQFHGDDMGVILRETFWRRLHRKPFELDRYFCYYIIYWREFTVPEVEFSPQGLGKVQWIWKLDVSERLHGVMHVGIDLKKRNFICFERNLGVYFPEGEKLERIYREIVQDPAMALDHIGRGRVQDSWINGSQPANGEGTPAGKVVPPSNSGSPSLQTPECPP